MEPLAPFKALQPREAFDAFALLAALVFLAPLGRWTGGQSGEDQFRLQTLSQPFWLKRHLNSNSKSILNTLASLRSKERL